MPALTLGLRTAAEISRLARSSLLEVIREEYITTARSKGLHENIVIYKHALKNAFIEVLTFLGIQFGRLLGGVVVVEVVFSWPGIGRFAIQAIWIRDYPVIQGIVLYLAVVFTLINFAVDILYGYLDPRIRYS